MGNEELQSVQTGQKQKVPAKKNYPLKALIIVIIILACILGFLIWKYYSDKNVAFTIDGQKYSKSEYNNLITDSAKYKVSKTNAKNQIIAIFKDQYVAQKLGITVPESEVEDNGQRQFSLYNAQASNLDSWEKLISWDTVFQNTVLLDKNGGYQGAVFYFPFDLLFVQSYPSSVHPDGWGVPSAIAAAQSYAQTQAQTIHSKLASNSITPGEAISSISKDPKLQAPNSGNGSLSFEANLNGVMYINGQTVTQILPSNVLASIKQLGHPGLTSVSLLNTTLPSWALAPGTSTPTSVEYYFTDLQSISSPQPNIQKTVNSSISGLKVKINV